MKMVFDFLTFKIQKITLRCNPGNVSILMAICFSVIGCKDNKVQEAIQWQPWEIMLKAKHKQESRPADLEVVFTGPGGMAFKGHAFTDNGIIYHIRAAFPESGTWNWSTVSSDLSDNGIHDKKGRVEVRPYNGDNPLYKHGDLKVSENLRYLVHSDNTPFLWMGETGWTSTQKSSIDEWHIYVDTRADQHFSVIQISPRGVSNNHAKDLAAISFREDGTIDPLFWEDLETKIKYANEKGIIIFMVGISKVWSDEFLKNPVNQRFETYITGRLAPYMVLFSPSFDQLFDKGNDSVALELNKFTSHLITQHPGTNYEANLKYRNSPSTDFCGLQSGHNGGRLERAYKAARSWTLDMWNGTPIKPVIDIEAMYDGYGSNKSKNWREKDARKLGWIAWLSGSRGYTYGAGDVKPKVPNGNGGVWRFNQDSTTYDYWRKAILWNSAGQMTIMHDFFNSMEWWKLVPSNDLILNQPGNDTLMMVASISNDNNMLLAYLPDNPLVELDLSFMSDVATGKWLNPVTGNYIALKSPVIPSENVPFKRPEGWEDAVLIVSKY